MNHMRTRSTRSSQRVRSGDYDNDVRDRSTAEREPRRTNAAGLPIITVDVADIPGGGQLHLLQCGKEFSIQFGTDELMGSQDHRSERALAIMTCDRLHRRDGHVLIGGLGMGFTLGAALEAWLPCATVTVAELVPKIVTWAKGPLSHLFGRNLADPRVRLRLTDVFDIIVQERECFDAILLDVDNGPDGFIKAGNDRLYSADGLAAAHAALKPGGMLSIWSSYGDDAFAERLEQAGFCIDEIVMPAHASSNGRWHNIWFAAKVS